MEERRDRLRRAARPLTAAAVALACGAGAPAWTCELPGARLLQSTAFSLAYRTVPPVVRAAEHFSVELRICAKPGHPSDRSNHPAANAHMPEHRHGMNYRPGMIALGEGRYRSDGWLFHMPGRWAFVFDVGGERVADAIRIE